MDKNLKDQWMCNLVDYLNIKNDKSSDLTIYCSDGVVQTQKLILVSISEMLCSALKEINPEEGETVIVPDVTAAHVSAYLHNICIGDQISSFTELDKLLGVKIFPSSDKLVKQEPGFESYFNLEGDFINDSEKLDGNSPHQNENDEVKDILGDYSENDEPKITKIRISNCTIPKISKSSKKRPKRDSYRALILEHFSSISEQEFSCNMCGKHFRKVKATSASTRQLSHMLDFHLEKVSNNHKDVLRRYNLKREKDRKYDKERRKCGSQIDPETGQPMEKKRGRPKGIATKGAPSYIWDHITTITTDEKYTCNYCNRSFTGLLIKIRGRISHHLAIEHEIFKEKHICSHCGKAWMIKSKQKICEGRCSKTYFFYCDYEGCKKGFIEKHELDQHKRVHSGEKPFQCNVCGTGFRQNAHLRTHMRVHTGSTPYQCKLCFQSFKYLPSRNMHKCSVLSIE